MSDADGFQRAIESARKRAAEDDHRTCIAYEPTGVKYVFYRDGQVLPWGCSYQGSVSVAGVYSNA